MTIINFTQTRGALPAVPLAVDVALEAGAANDRATAVIGAAWAMAETFTGRNYWPVTAAVLTMQAGDDCEAWWPRAPAPAAVTMERLSGREWVADTGPMYMADAGWFTFLAPGATYRFTQVGTVTPAPSANVLEAVRALALYSLIQSPARTEFRQIQAGDSTLTREALGGVFAMSGAGAMLAWEVRW
ncbi:MAG: hypothetical protein ACT4OK_10775 [Gemmobacter sp.]